MTSIARTLGVAILGTALAGTAAWGATVNVNFQNPAELARNHTYTFESLSTTNPMIEPRLAIAIDRELQLRGWHEAPKGDVVVTAVLAGYRDPQLYQDFYENLDNLAWNSAAVDPIGRSVEEAPAGTLIVDMYNRRTGQLIWRSTASDFLGANTNKNVIRVDNLVSRMFSQIPFDDAPQSYNPWINPS
jgi:hypothetical protein